MQTDQAIEHRWSPDRPNVLVVACSDGRLQEVTDAFLRTRLGIVRYDRLYAPRWCGCPPHSGSDFMRARQMRQECRYLIDLHQVEWTILLFHSPTHDGPMEAMCADYRRKIPWASVDMLRDRQVSDAQDLRHDARHSERRRWIFFAAKSITTAPLRSSRWTRWSDQSEQL